MHNNVQVLRRGQMASSVLPLDKKEHAHTNNCNFSIMIYNCNITVIPLSNIDFKSVVFMNQKKRC